MTKNESSQGNSGMKFFLDCEFTRLNSSTKLIHLFKNLEAGDIGEVALPELPHDALIDAQILAELYQRLSAASSPVGDRQ